MVTCWKSDSAPCVALRYADAVSGDGVVWWPDEQADYIRRLGERYPGAVGIDPEWTVEAAADPQRIVWDPDPRSHTGASGSLVSHSALDLS